MEKDRSVILITGASGGIGRAVAERFGRTGCRIALHYFQNRTRAEDLAETLTKDGAEVITGSADLRSLQAMRDLMASLLTHWNRLDAMILCAAVRHDRLLARSSEADWDDVLGVNLTGAWNSLKAAGETMIRQKHGHVIALGSIAAAQGRAGQANYAASKAGLIGLIRSAALEWAPHNVRLNIVYPGFQATGMTESMTDRQRRNIQGQGLLDQSPPIEEVAGFIYHLSRMNGVTGQIFNLDSRIH